MTSRNTMINHAFTVVKPMFFMLLCFFMTGLYAQTAHGEADRIMQNLAAKYQAFNTMQINYTYKVESGKRVTQTFTGKAYIKGNRYQITFGDQIFYCNGTTMWSYQKSTNEVSVYAYEESDDDALNPAKMLKEWQKDFTAKFIREDVEKSIPVQIIDLTPRQGQSYYKIRLVIDKAKQTILRTSIYEKNNVTYSYCFDKFVSDSAIADSTFVFDKTKFPKVEVNDMR